MLNSLIAFLILLLMNISAHPYRSRFIYTLILATCFLNYRTDARRCPCSWQVSFRDFCRLTLWSLCNSQWFSELYECGVRICTLLISVRKPIIKTIKLAALPRILLADIGVYIYFKYSTRALRVDFGSWSSVWAPTVV